MENLFEKLQQQTIVLSNLCAQYETTYFLTYLSSILLSMPRRYEHPALRKLKSPLKQIFYAACLNICAEKPGSKPSITENEWDAIALLLEDIETEYSMNLAFYHVDDDTIDKDKISVVLPTFLNYFCSGPLSYQEQEMERIVNTFVHFETQIFQEFGVTPRDFVNFYEFVDSLMNEKLNKALHFAKGDRWKEFTNECLAKGLNDPKDWIKEAPEEITAYARLMNDPGYLVVININDISEDIADKDKFIKIIKLLSCSNCPTNELIYYTSRNPLLEKPIYQIDNDHYLMFFQKHILDATYKFLFNFCKSKGDKIYHQRDKLLEVKVEELFSDFFQKKAFIYKSYYVDGHSEQDLLVLYKGMALIIECKAATFREPMRDPLRAYDRIKSDFKKNIQYGYDQTYRVKSKFNENQPFDITDNKGKVQYRVDPRRYRDVFSLVVTLDRFGMIQTDLSAMLSLNEDELYPWAINIDDLEAILLVMAKRGGGQIGQFRTYLDYREGYHGHVICDDELELCGMFLQFPKKFIERSMMEESIVLEPGYTKPIEDAYRQGLGFKNERYYDEKISKKIGFMY